MVFERWTRLLHSLTRHLHTIVYYTKCILRWSKPYDAGQRALQHKAQLDCTNNGLQLTIHTYIYVGRPNYVYIGLKLAVIQQYNFGWTRGT